jgi:FkbM family methyltransferase
VIDVEQCLEQFYEERKELRALADVFLSDSAAVHRYVLGQNRHAMNCVSRVHIEGIVDDFAGNNQEWQGIPIMPSARIPKGAIVVNCSMSIRPVSAHMRLADIPGITVLSYADLVRADPEFPLPDFVVSFRRDYAENDAKWRALEHRLDDHSCSVLQSLMTYRLTGDARHMSRFSVNFKDQYFDPVAPLSDSEVFVDCGGYDGDTVLEFCSRMARFKHIYMFEPSPANFERARVRLRRVKDVSLIPYGVSDKPGKLRFDPAGGSASAVSTSGSMAIDVVTIDDYIPGAVTYIKMDLEGWELQALKGAKRHIVEDFPKLAIAVYHNASDFWRIPEYVLHLRDEYSIHIRHYSEGWSETVMYFVPRSLC